MAHGVSGCGWGVGAVEFAQLDNFEPGGDTNPLEVARAGVRPPAAVTASPGMAWGTTFAMTFPPLFIYALALLGFVVTNLIFARIGGPRKKTVVKEMPYESGMDPVGDARQPFDVKFYLVAILFLVFDVELLFLYPWAVSAFSDAGIPAGLRDTVFVLMLVFMATLVIAYIYAWRKGVFRWR
jgi:NADH-quinone oxidoreductase subunit A